MKTPKRIQPLVDDGLIDEVLHQLMSGKEATVYLVRRGTEICCAKVYKDAAQRSFQTAVLYQEGRNVRNSRRARAMQKRSRFGRGEQEQIWQSAEVDALYLLSSSGVRVPQPYGCFDGVLLMELITDEDGQVAPRLNDVVLSEEQAREGHAVMMRYVVRMLCAGMIHGDLSEFNVLLNAEGPVIIDLPQAIFAASNNNAWSMLEHDVQTITSYYARFAPDLADGLHAKEIWDLYKAGNLHPEVELTGTAEIDTELADVDAVMVEIEAARLEEEKRLQRLADREGSTSGS